MARARSLWMVVVLVSALGVARAGKPAVGPARAKKVVVILVGYPGSGKGEVGKILGRVSRARGWVSSDVIREELRRRGLEELPANLSAVGKEMQQAEPGVVGRRLGQKIAASRARRHYIDGLRAVADIDAVRELFPDAKLVKVDVPADVRHVRMLARGRLGETSVEILKARDAADEKLGVGDLMLLDSGPGESFHLTPGDGLPALRKAAQPVIDHMR